MPTVVNARCVDDSIRRAAFCRTLLPLSIASSIQGACQSTSSFSESTAAQLRLKWVERLMANSLSSICRPRLLSRTGDSYSDLAWSGTRARAKPLRKLSPYRS